MEHNSTEKPLREQIGELNKIIYLLSRETGGRLVFQDEALAKLPRDIEVWISKDLTSFTTILEVRCGR